MKQVLQNLSSGETRVEELPAPKATANTVIVASRATLISAGTERMLVTFGKSSLLAKARQQPERVRQVIEKVQTDGLLTTIDAVRSKLDQPLALGYCNAGMIVDVGPGVKGFKRGDRVVSNGSHAELVRVPINLCATIPEGVDDESASFAVLGAIGLQSVRLAAPTLGESFVVIGLGLIGLVVVQLLAANGCHVLGIDLDPNKLSVARKLGCEVFDATLGDDPVAAALGFSKGRGADAVIIAASTQSSEPISQAAKMCRKRGRVVLVGATGTELNRADFYEKELSFQVSCSYGPGRYDPAYEERGQDYPIGFVRWTAQRNFEAILSLMQSGHLDVHSLVSHRFDFEDVVDAYEVLTSDKSALGIVLRYPEQHTAEAQGIRRIALADRLGYAATEPVLGVFGAGNYASRILIPAFKAAGARFETIVTMGGASGVHHGRKAGFAFASTDPADIIGSPAVNAVVIATRHDTHAKYVLESMAAGKSVFVEKPLAVTLAEVDAIEQVARAPGAPRLMVGFNRRFAPLVRTMKVLMDRVVGPKALIYTCNAGTIPPDHWTQDDATGGGRIVGEACHFIDLLRHMTGSQICETQVVSMNQDRGDLPSDSAIISLRFADGSIGTIQYLSNGGKRFPKERLECFAGDAVLQLNNFRSLIGYNWPRFSRSWSWRQDKGQEACASEFLAAMRAGLESPIPLNEIIEVARTTIDVANKQRERNAGNVDTRAS